MSELVKSYRKNDIKKIKEVVEQDNSKYQRSKLK
jgi:hypothetical protein